MKVAYSWLKEYIKTDLEPEALATLLTNTGLEVESLEKFQNVKGGLHGLVVGEVLNKIKHPNADKLVVTKVNVGNGEPLQIVCGAPNVEVGQKVVVATPGTTIHPINGEPFTIKKAKIRGESSSGMICAEDEIGLGDSHDGIMVLSDDKKPGAEIKADYNIYEDWVFEIGLTPNRIDAASHVGVCRDIKAVLGMKSPLNVELPSVSAFKPDTTKYTTNVKIEDPHACKRYCGVSLHNIKVGASPQWMQNRLLSVGLRPINNVVDITNYVLMETGQPLHAFDIDKIIGDVIVKQLSEGTNFVTLDGVERKLSAKDLMICNEKEAMCIAGVFGGENSGVTEKTTKIFLESAYFDPASVRATSKKHGLNTDASFRFERGVDPEMLVYAAKRAALLLKEIAGAEIVSDITDFYPQKIENAKVELRFNKVDTLTGINFDSDLLKNIIQNLDMIIDSESKEKLSLSIPAYRVDVTGEADVVEEILRIYGYDNVPLPEKLNFSLPDSIERTDSIAVQNKIGDFLVSHGFNEISNNSLFAEKHAELQLAENHSGVEILNPLSNELNYMRSGLLANGLQSLAYNINRRNSNLKFFEFGNTYSKKDGKYMEELHLSILLTGNKQDESWLSKKGDAYTEFYLKSLVEDISHLGIRNSTVKSSHASGYSTYLKSSFSYQIKNKAIAEYGDVKKSVLKDFDLDQNVWYAEINFTELLKFKQSGDFKVKGIPKFPEVKRDLSMIIDSNITFDELKKAALKTENKLLKEVKIFDVYEGENIGAGKKSYALSFILQSADKTLTDEEIDAVMNKLMKIYEKDFSAQIRK